MARVKEYEQKLLVAGFIRGIEKMYKIKNIPNEINDIIYLYQRLYDEWDTKWTNDYVNIDETNTTITIKEDDESNMGHAIAFGKRVVSEGIYIWKIKIICIKLTFESPPYVGIIENNEEYLKRYRDDFLWDNVGYQLCGGNSVLCGPLSSNYHKTSDYQCLWKKEGDVVEIILDLNERTLGFKVNDIDYGVAFSNIHKTEYRLAVSTLSMKGSKFAFV